MIGDRLAALEDHIGEDSENGNKATATDGLTNRPALLKTHPKQRGSMYGLISTVRKHQLTIFDQCKPVIEERNPDFVFQGGK